MSLPPVDPPPHLDGLTIVGLDREQLRSAVYRRVFGDEVPFRIGRYTVLERIGSGGMGVVFKAYDTSLDRKVAVKVIRFSPGERTSHGDLVAEAQALAKLSHPNVVHVYEVGQAAEGDLFLAMEFVEGPTLRDWLAQGYHRWQETLDVCVQAGAGLAAAHRVELVHRDFKPDNVVVAVDGRPRVLDFGLALQQVLPTAHSETERRERLALMSTIGRGGIMGTPAYMAPEQIDGKGLGPAADQFAFCTAMFEALFNVRPYAGDDLNALREAMKTERLAVPEGRGGVPKQIHRTLAKGLRVDPAARHASMEVLLGELDAVRRRGGWGRSIGLVIAAVGTIAAVTIAFAPAMIGLPDTAAEVRASHEQHEASELLLERARSTLPRDPTAAVEMLADLDPSASSWGTAVHPIVEQAAALGLAEREVALDPSFEVEAIVGDHVLGHLRGNEEVLAVDTASERPAKVSLPFDSQSADGRLPTSRLLAAPDQRRMVAHDETSAWVVDLAIGKRVALPVPHGHRCAFSADGKRIACFREGAVAVLDMHDGKLAFAVREPDVDERVVLALDADGSHVAMGKSTGRITVHAATGRRVLDIDRSAAALAFLPDADAIAVAHPAGGVTRIELADGTASTVVASDRRFVTIDVTPEGRWLVGHEPDRGHIEVHDLVSGRMRAWEAEGSAVLAPDGRFVAFATQDGAVRAVELRSGRERTLRSSGRIEYFAFSPSSSAIVAGGTVGGVRRWPLEPAPAVFAHSNPVAAMGFSADGRSLLTADIGGRSQRWDVATGAAVTLGEDTGRIIRFLASPDGKFLASRTSGGTVVVRDATSGTVLGTTEGSNDAFAFLDGALIGKDPNSLWRWDLQTGERQPWLESLGHCSAVAVAPGGRRIAARCSADGNASTLRVWELPGLELLLESDHRTDRHVFWSGGEVVVGGTFGDPPLAIDVASGTAVPFDTERSFDFVACADAETLAGWPSTAEGPQWWSSKLAPVTVPVALLDATFHIVAISPDGKMLAYAPDHRTVVIEHRTVPAEPDALRTWIAEHRVERAEAQ